MRFSPLSKRPMTQRLYPKAPIAEAVIDIQVRHPESASPDRFQNLADSLKTQFPTQVPIQVQVLHMDVTSDEHGGMQAKHESSSIGYRLASESGDRVLQITKRGMAYSHMPPYSEWAKFKSEAQTLWGKYTETCMPEHILRSAIRYINKISVPKESIDLQDYFNLYPKVPSGMPQNIAGAFLQLLMPLPEIAGSATALVNLAIAPPEKPKHVTVLLDFDLYCLELLPPSSDRVWEIFEAFRSKKNELFEASITDETRKLIS